LSVELTKDPQAVGPATAYLLAGVAMAIWGSPPVVARAVSSEVPPLALAFFRWFVALLVLLPFVWRKLRAEWPMLRLHWRPLFVVSMFMTAGSSLSVLAVYFTTATNAVLVNASQPAVTAAFAWLAGRDRLSRRQALGIGCAFAGIVVMICRADLGVLTSLDINIGDLIMLMAVCGWSLYAVKLHHRDYLPSSEVMLFVIALSGSVMLLPLYLIELSQVGTFAFRTDVWGAIVYLAVFASVLAVLFWNLALHSLGPNRAAVFVNLIPIFGAAFAVLLLGEHLFFYHLLGAAFVFTGIFLAVRRRVS
jgi:drug/metabolite transporter (DMT)-like permease